MKSEDAPFYPHLCAVPIMKPVLFAELSGFSEGVVEGWINRGYIPVVKVGKLNALNMVLITHRLLNGLPLDSDAD